MSFPVMTLFFFILMSCGKNSTTPSDRLSEGNNAFMESCHRDNRVLPVYRSNKNYLAFENFAVGGIGRCRGHVIVSQAMEMLSKFDSRRPHPCYKQDEVQCYSTLYKLITNILGGQIQVIGGYDSLYSFSSDPLAQRILRIKIASTSHRYHAEESPLASYQYPTRNENIFHDILRRLNLKHRPYIGMEGTLGIGDHAVLAYKSQEQHGRQVICIRDPNIVIRGIPFENCQNFLYLKGHEVFYHQIGRIVEERLWSISLQTDEDDRMRQYIKLRHQFCQREQTNQVY